MALTSRCTPNWGSTSISTSHASLSETTSAAISVRCVSTRPSRTRHRYLAHHTTWKAHWKVALLVERRVANTQTLHSGQFYIANVFEGNG